jgi:hypothetical protein
MKLSDLKNRLSLFFLFFRLIDWSFETYSIQAKHYK